MRHGANFLRTGRTGRNRSHGDAVAAAPCSTPLLGVSGSYGNWRGSLSPVRLPRSNPIHLTALDIGAITGLVAFLFGSALLALAYVQGRIVKEGATGM